jgi:hypothetical protein
VPEKFRTDEFSGCFAGMVSIFGTHPA